jgi:hypothetical protein
MTKFNVTNVLAGAATAVALTMAVSGSALAAHGGGVGGHVGGGIGPGIGHNTLAKIETTNKIETTKWRHLDRERFERDRRFRFREFGYLGAGVVTPYCFYKLTPLGRVRVCPDIAY